MDTGVLIGCNGGGGIDTVVIIRCIGGGGLDTWGINYMAWTYQGTNYVACGWWHGHIVVLIRWHGSGGIDTWVLNKWHGHRYKISGMVVVTWT